MTVINGRLSRRLLLTCAIACLPVGLVQAASPTNATVVSVGEMCGGCVTKITTRLEQMNDVGSIVCDTKAKTVTILPKTGKTLSARVVWEAMDGIGKTPQKLVGPSGTYTAKPKS